mmetsp:Transcript_8718/g.27048  ORF Transcript_8718/g.27048 Transcript_8718/m.27048 type:complete len:722 (-) Transcript_8718:48-2213(-)
MAPHEHQPTNSGSRRPSLLVRMAYDAALLHRQQQICNRSKAAFVQLHTSFMNERGTPITKVPTMGHKELDLYILYREFIKRGGLGMVIESHLLRTIANVFDPPPTCTNAGWIVRRTYFRMLFAFEQVDLWQLGDTRLDYSLLEMKNCPVPVKYDDRGQLMYLLPPLHARSGYTNAIGTVLPPSDSAAVQAALRAHRIRTNGFPTTSSSTTTTSCASSYAESFSDLPSASSSSSSSSSSWSSSSSSAASSSSSSVTTGAAANIDPSGTVREAVSSGTRLRLVLNSGERHNGGSLTPTQQREIPALLHPLCDSVPIAPRDTGHPTAVRPIFFHSSQRFIKQYHTSEFLASFERALQCDNVHLQTSALHTLVLLSHRTPALFSRCPTILDSMYGVLRQRFPESIPFTGGNVLTEKNIPQGSLFESDSAQEDCLTTVITIIHNVLHQPQVRRMLLQHAPLLAVLLDVLQSKVGPLCTTLNVLEIVAMLATDLPATQVSVYQRAAAPYLLQRDDLPLLEAAAALLADTAPRMASALELFVVGFEPEWLDRVAELVRVPPSVTVRDNMLVLCCYVTHRNADKASKHHLMVKPLFVSSVVSVLEELLNVEHAPDSVLLTQQRANAVYAQQAIVAAKYARQNQDRPPKRKRSRRNTAHDDVEPPRLPPATAHSLVVDSCLAILQNVGHVLKARSLLRPHLERLLALSFYLNCEQSKSLFATLTEITTHT